MAHIQLWKREDDFKPFFCGFDVEKKEIVLSVALKSNCLVKWVMYTAQLP